MRSRRLEILRQFRSLLSYHNVVGIEHYPRSESSSAFLQHEPVCRRARPSRDKPCSTDQSSSLPIQQKQPVLQGTIAAIAEEVRSCVGCDLAQQRLVPVPGNGGEAPRLFLVGGWLMLEKKDAEADVVFGAAEDRMLERMLVAIHLDRDDAFVTNVIKCGIDETVQPKAENIHACSSYLERQIAATSPEIICAMGITAARALLQISQPLSQLRGQLHEYRLEQRTIPLIVTYHPTFLLQNPEMKSATWADLQLIMKVLGNRKR